MAIGQIMQHLDNILCYLHMQEDLQQEITWDPAEEKLAMIFPSALLFLKSR